MFFISELISILECQRSHATLPFAVIIVQPQLQKEQPHVTVRTDIVQFFKKKKTANRAILL